MLEYIEKIGSAARTASRVLAIASTEEKNDALRKIAEAILKEKTKILAANQIDLANGKENGLSDSLLDRLMLNEERLNAISESILNIISLEDPVGRLLEKKKRPNGLLIQKVSVPIGVIAVIYEARPNVTVDSAALCLKSGNVVILRGGKEAINTNVAVAKVMRNALTQTKIPQDAIQLVTVTDHESSNELMHASEYVDLLIPRGGKNLIKAVVQNATVPVIETGAGVCHIYVDQDADPEKAISIVYNAKTSRPSVCNAAECMIVHEKIAETILPKIAKKLKTKDVEIRADEKGCQILGSDAKLASQEDYGREYGDYIITLKVVRDIEEAIEYIRTYSTGHSEAIITENDATAEIFMNAIDSAAVYQNASTRFTDGGEFGFGAEIGISTQKLHARGPLGLRELTTTKYKIYGNGQIR